MTTLLQYWSIFYDNIVPIFIAAGAGFALGRRFKPDLRSITRLAFYIFSPCLVFVSITHSQLSSADFWQVAALTLAIMGLVAAIILTGGAILRLERRTLAALVVAAVFGNAGNYGLAVNKLAFGDAAVARAVIFFSFSTMLTYTLGVAVASSGTRSWREVLRHGLTLPTTYALGAAGLFRLTGWPVPQPVDSAVSIMSQGSIPVMLVLLGLQIAAVTSWPRTRLALMGLASTTQLVVAPAIALVLVTLFGVIGPTRQAIVLQSGMPTAVFTTILAVEYDLDVALVSGTVILATLLSPLTLTPLIAYLQR